MTTPTPAKYAYTPKDAVLAAGTQTQFCIKGATEWTPVQGVTAIGQVGEKASTQEQTTLEDTAKRYQAGMFDGPDKELKGKYYDGDTGQVAFFAAAQARENVMILHVWPDGVTATYELALLGYFRDETQGEQGIGWVVPGKQSGETTWGKLSA